MEKQQVVVIVGPTAVGKTALGVKLAQDFNGEVISGDSLQVYRGLDIGTAKVTKEETMGVTHHLIDIIEPTEDYSVYEFKQEATKIIDRLSKEGKLPIIVGGTGLYIQALLYDFNLGSNTITDEELLVRNKWEMIAKNLSKQELWEKLDKVDPAASKVIHPNNQRRVLRALEVIELTGVSITNQQKVDFLDLDQSIYDVMLIGLNTDRDVLYQRINQRVDMMIEAGLIEEAKFVYDLGETQSSKGIGYKEFFPYFKGNINLEEASQQVKQNSRRYAKRQLTWFNNRMTVSWWNLVEYPKSISRLEEKLKAWYKG